MSHVLIFFLITTSFVQFQGATGFVSWLFREKDIGNDPSAKENVPTDIVTSKRSTPFEMQTTDEKFLAESHFTKDLSPLDLCHHWVIAELTNTCSELTEEELAKLSVQLLNCQSQAEDRQVYPCTEEMSIADCTRDMDPVTWNAYQIVSNRARAVCYATRQQHFRMKTEFTVNHLVNTAQEQLNSLYKLQEGHNDLHELTQDTLVQVKESHEEIATSQQRLLRVNQNVNSYIVGNIKELVKEKALIASGHRELATMTELLQRKLDETKEKIMEQGLNQRENHNEILEDLALIRNRAHEVLWKIEQGSNDMIHFKQEADEQYQHTLDNLQKISSTIQYLDSTINNMKVEVQGTLDWIAGMVGGTGDKMALLSIVFLHSIYFLMGALLSAFLQTPQFSRLLLLSLVPLNAWAQVHTQKSLTFIPMTMFIILTTAANWALTSVWCLYMRYKFSKRCSRVTSNNTSQISADGTKCAPENNGHHNCNGLSTPDLKRCVSLLEKLCNAENTPQRPLADANAGLHEMIMPNNTPSTPKHQLDHVSKWLDQTVDGFIGDMSTSTPKKDKSPAPSYASTPIRRHAPDINLSLAASDYSYSSKPELAMTLDHLLKKDKKTSRRSSVSKSNRSIRRPLCLATTKSNMPCKMSSVAGSAFCFVHQVAK